MDQERRRYIRDEDLTVEDYVEMAEGQIQFVPTNANTHRESGYDFDDSKLIHTNGRISQEQLNELMNEGLERATQIIENPEAYYNQSGDNFRPPTPEAELRRYQQWNAATIAASRGDRRGLIHLGAFLATEHVDKKMTMHRFLGLLTNGQVGHAETTFHFPNRAEDLRWISTIKDMINTTPTPPPQAS